MPLSAERKRVAKLELSRETLRALDSNLLERVRGGLDATQDCPTWPVVTTVTAPLTERLRCDLT